VEIGLGWAARAEQAASTSTVVKQTQIIRRSIILPSFRISHQKARHDAKRLYIIIIEQKAKNEKENMTKNRSA